MGDLLFDDDTGRVNMSLEYFERIYEYKVRVDETQEVYKKIQEMNKKILAGEAEL